MTMNRVVVTAVSAITPIGNDVEASWENLCKGVCGIGPLTRFDTTEYDTKIAAEVKDFDHSPYIPHKQARRMEEFTRLAVSGSQMLLANAGWEIPEEEKPRVACIIGCGLGGLETIEIHYQKLVDMGPKRVSPFFIPIVIGNMAPGQVSIFTGAQGPNITTTTACASGTHAIGDAYTDIMLGRCDAAITGGVESVMTKTAVAGFNSMKALSTRNDDPKRASRPFDRDRDGFIIGEGCGLLLLESLDHAKARGAKILAEVVGFGASGDAHHMTAPPENGEGMALAMGAAIKEAGVDIKDVDTINAHGTSTELNDLCETRAIKALFGKHAYDLKITANKSMIGHLLGGAGGVESVFSVLTLNRQTIPGTINLENPGDECDLNYMASGTEQCGVNYVLSNSFGFGGTNASLLFKKFQD
jgi:3-oxoacyl-[acyl-carrier-protein] synthase II